MRKSLIKSCRHSIFHLPRRCRPVEILHKLCCSAGALTKVQIARSPHPISRSLARKTGQIYIRAATATAAAAATATTTAPAATNQPPDKLARFARDHNLGAAASNQRGARRRPSPTASPPACELGLLLAAATQSGRKRVVRAARNSRARRWRAEPAGRARDGRPRPPRPIDPLGPAALPARAAS
jgi:hypothetical protein